MTALEAAYRLLKMNKVAHTTFNPRGPGVVRIHLVPPKFTLKDTPPSVVVLNGKDIVPINMSWAILLDAFIDEVNMYEGKEIDQDAMDNIVCRTMEKVKRVYHRTEVSKLREDLLKIVKNLD